MDDHPIMQPGNRLAARADEEAGHYRMYEACQRGAEQ